MSEREHNAKINKLQRQLVNAVERIKTLELDVEPEGRISEGFTVLEEHMDQRFDNLEARINRMEKQYNSRFDRMEHQFNRLQGTGQSHLNFGMPMVPQSHQNISINT